MNKLVSYLKEQKKIILLSAILVMVVYGINAFTTNVRIDTEALMVNPGSDMEWGTIGRYALVFTKQMLGLDYFSMFKSGLIFCICFILGCNLICYGFSLMGTKELNQKNYIFVILYCTSTIWSFQFFFSLQQAEVALVMDLVILAAMINTIYFRKKVTFLSVILLLLSTAAIVWGLGTYQALAPFYIGLCIVFYIVIYFKNIQENQFQWKKEIIQIVCLIVQFLIAYEINSLIVKTWFSNSEYLNDQIGWSTQPLFSCFAAIVKNIGAVVINFGAGYASFYTFGLIAMIVFYVKYIRKNINDQGTRVFGVLAFAGLAISPFMLTIMIGSVATLRAQLTLPLVAAFLGMAAFYWAEKEGALTAKKILKALFILTVVVQVFWNYQLQYTDSVRNTQDKEMVATLVDMIEAQNDGEFPEQPVVIVGTYKSKLNRFCYRCDVYGESFWGWDYNINNPTLTTSRVVNFAKAACAVNLNGDYDWNMQQLAIAESGGMTDFPAEGSVIVHEDYIVVKLSDIQ